MVNRERLDEIILKDGTNNWWKPDLFKKNTQELLPDELEVLYPPPSRENNYNCFIHAFGLSNDTEILKDSNGFIYDTFFKKLLNEGILTQTEEPQDGDYILYKDIKNYPHMITHIGVMDGDKIISKWAWGPLIRHSVFDVPASYGDDISYVKKINKTEAKNLYQKYREFNKKLVS